MLLTAKSTSRYSLIKRELERLDAIYAELRPNYSVSVTNKVADYYSAYDTRNRRIVFVAKFLDGPRAKSDAHIIDSVRHEYAHMIIEQFAPEDSAHGSNWVELATFLGVNDIAYHASPLASEL